MDDDYCLGMVLMRGEAEITRELDEVRTERKRVFPTQAEPLAVPPEPAGVFPGEPGAKIVELLEREAQLMLERAESRRDARGELDPETGAEAEEAERILARIAERRTTPFEEQ